MLTRLCSEDDTIGDLKKLVAAHAGAWPAARAQQAVRRRLCVVRRAGTRPEKIRIQKWYNVFKDHITLADYEIHDGMARGCEQEKHPLSHAWPSSVQGLELYYN